MRELSKKKDKDSRIKLTKIQDYINILATYGTRAGEKYVKHLQGEIWELRPLRDRILFAAWTGKTFVILEEIEKAKRELAEIMQSEVRDNE